VIEEYWRSILEGSDPTVQTRILADLAATPKETVVGVFEALRYYDPLPALQRYRGPALSVVTPLNETPFSLHNLHPDLPHTTITGTGHWLHVDRPGEFNRILDDFIERVERAGS
jgi:pimeloyl-ACP methyl ester carboxylesterase